MTISTRSTWFSGMLETSAKPPSRPDMPIRLPFTSTKVPRSPAPRRFTVAAPKTFNVPLKVVRSNVSPSVTNMAASLPPP